MSFFLTRIVVTNGTEEDYNILKQAMLAAGFTDIIHGKYGNGYRLPAGEYFADTPDSLQWVYREACMIAKSIKRDSVIIVSQTVDYQCNLKPVLLNLDKNTTTNYQ